MTTAITWALIHSLWQATLLALFLVSVRFATRSPQLRYAAGLAVLACTLASFGATLLLFLPTEKLVANPAAITAPSPILLEVASKVRYVAAKGGLDDLTPYIAYCWLIGVCLSHVWQLAGMVSVWRLRRRGVWPAGDVWARQLTQLCHRLRVSRPVTLLESVMINAPVVIGHLRPVILVPAGLLANFPAAQMEAVLLHELAHIRRCDYLVNIFQRWIEALFFYHPAVWWISHVIRTERENCCDDIAVIADGDGQRYAQALASLEESRVLQPALSASAGPLADRIERILQRNAGTGFRGGISSFTLVAATAMLAVAGWRQAQSPTTVAAQSKSPDTLVAQRGTPPRQAIAAEEASPWRKWVNEDVLYIIKDSERAAYNRLTTDDDRQTFVQQFWARRGESAKEEHYRRLSYANQRFGATLPGWKTDRGRIYITLGPPAEIESHPSAQGDRPAYEIWRYRPVAGVSGPQSFTFADLQNNGDFQLQTPSSPHPVFNRLIRWTVTDPLNRFVTGLQQEHFNVSEDGFTKSLMYFEGPDSPTAIAVCSVSDITDLNNLPVRNLAQTRTLDDAVRYVTSNAATRKAIVNAGCATSAAEPAIPGGILIVNTEPTMVSRTIIELANQYVGGYMSATGTSHTDVTISKPPAGLPPLTVGRLVQ
jgi:GWxTD domain-containing protein